MRQANEVNVLIHFRDVDTDEDVREHLTARCQHLASEFPETDHYELTLEHESGHVRAHGHVTGKHTEAAAHSPPIEGLRAAGDTLLEKLRTELRKHHDKRIFAERRREQKKRASSRSA